MLKKQENVKNEMLKWNVKKLENVWLEIMCVIMWPIFYDESSRKSNIL